MTVPASICPDEASAEQVPCEAREFDPAAYAHQRTRLVLLGTSGGPPYWPGGTREGIASALVVGDRYYLVDAGHGVARQLREARLGPHYDTDFDGPLDVLAGVFLTHLHSDHTVDLPNILTEGLYNGLQHADRFPIWGPGNRGQLPPVFGGREPPEPVGGDSPTPGTRETVDLLVRAYATDINDRMFDNSKPHPSQLWEAKDVPVPPRYTADPNGNPCPEMAPFTFYEDDRVRVSATLVNHAPVFPALAYRFDTDDGSVVFSGDTGKNPNLVALARDTDVLVHEVIDKTWVASLSPEPRTPEDESMYHHLLQAHTLVEDVGRVAQEANAKTLVLSHIVPGNGEDSQFRRAGDGFDGRLVIGRDLDVIGVGRR
ncbi:MBL fold metallo-hydrolase [Streptomyces sp. NPDC102360]|uniref:MBL fold metallo-hydrolase n=1 Tax=Streptomyces sp. NPDC102360 TaxID=3366160 RepID=UPI0037F8932C